MKNKTIKPSLFNPVVLLLSRGPDQVMWPPPAAKRGQLLLCQSSLMTSTLTAKPCNELINSFSFNILNYDDLIATTTPQCIEPCLSFIAMTQEPCNFFVKQFDLRIFRYKERNVRELAI